MWALIGLTLLAVTLQGVQVGAEVGPSESECRPYIEKAIHNLKSGESAEVKASSAEADKSDQDNSLEQDQNIAQSGEAESSNPGSHEETDDNDDNNTAEDTQEADSHEEAGADENKSGEDDNDTREKRSVNEDESNETKENESEQEASKEDADGDDKSDEEAQQQDGSDEAADGSAEVQDQNDSENKSGEDSQEQHDETANISEEEKANSSAQDEQDAAKSGEESGEDNGDSKEDDNATKETDEDSHEAEADGTQEDGESGEQSEEDKSEEQPAEQTAESDDQSVEEEEAQRVERSADNAEVSEEAPESGEDASLENASVEQIEEGASSEEESKELGGEIPQELTEHSLEVSDEQVEEPPSGETDSKENQSDEADNKSGEKDDSDEPNDSKESEEQKAEDTQESEEEKQSADDSKADDDKSTEDSEEDSATPSAEDDKQSEEETAGQDEKSSQETDEESDEVAQLNAPAKAAPTDNNQALTTSDESHPEDDLLMEYAIPENLRDRSHVAELLHLDNQSEEKEAAINKVADVILKDLKRIYENAIKPLETTYKYRDLSNRHFGDPEIFSKPLVLFMGPWSGGKSSILNYLSDNEYTPHSLRTGAEPSPAYFNILMHGDEPEVLDGTQLAADWTFSGLQKFGQGLEDRLRGLKLPSKLLEKVNIVEIPGILEVRKQVSRLFPFNDACQWFIDRADLIFLVYDPSKLDVGPETEAILDQLKGREYQTRIILNKADQVKPEELLRVQGALIWNISPLMSSAQPPVMYTTSLWSNPYETGAPIRLLQAQERAFLRDLRSAIDRRIEHKIASARRFAVRVRNHAKMVDCYLTTYYNHKSLFGNKKQIADQIIEHPQNYHIYEGLSTLTNISRYDLPDPEVYRDFFRLNPLYEFKKLSETCTYFRGCPINKLDISIAYDLPELGGKYKKLLDQSLNALEAEKEKETQDKS